MIHRLAKDITWLVASRVLMQAYFFCSTIYIANLLSPGDYALMGVGMILIGFLTLITEFGLGDALVQCKDPTDDEITGVFWFSLGTGGFISLCGLLLSHPVESFFAKPGVAEIIQILSSVLLLRSASIVSYKLIEKKMRLRVKAVIDTTAKLISVTSGIVLAYLGHGVWALVYAQVINELTISILSFVFEPFKPRPVFRFREIRSMMLFGLNIMGLRFTWYFRGGIDKVIGGKFLSSLDFGYYAFGFKLAQNIQTIIHNVMNIVSLPLLSKIQDDHDQVNQKYLLMVRYAALFVLPVFLGGFLLSREIVELFFSEKWLPIINIFKIACLVQILRMMNATTENLYIALGKPQYSLKVNLISLVVFGASFFWSVRWGVQGLLAAWMVILPALFLGWTSFVLKDRNIPVVSYLNSIKPALSASLSMCILIYVMKNLILNRIEFTTRAVMAADLLILVLSGALIYALTAYFVDKTVITTIIGRMGNAKP